LTGTSPVKYIITGAAGGLTHGGLRSFRLGGTNQDPDDVVLVSQPLGTVLPTGRGPAPVTMALMEITVAIPAPLSDRPIDELATRARLLLVIDEVRAGRLTRVGVARALDLSLDEFLVEAGRHGLEAIDYDVEDFKRELATISKATR